MDFMVSKWPYILIAILCDSNRIALIECILTDILVFVYIHMIVYTRTPLIQNPGEEGRWRNLNKTGGETYMPIILEKHCVLFALLRNCCRRSLIYNNFFGHNSPGWSYIFFVEVLFLLNSRGTLVLKMFYEALH